MTEPFQTIGKPLAMRTVELIRALQLVADSLEAVRRGRAHHLIGLSAQLRMLLVDRTKGADPLLLYMAAVLRKELKLFCTRGVDNPDFPADIKKKLSTWIARGPATLTKKAEYEIELSLTEYVNHKVVLHNGHRYSA